MYGADRRDSRDPDAPLSSSDEARATVRLLRQLLTDPTDRDRERFAGDSFRYIRAFILTHFAQRRFGFDDRFADVATGAADVEIAVLLRVAPGSGSDGAGPARELPRLRAALARRIRKESPEAAALLACGRIPPDLSDELLFHASRSILRGLAHDGILEAWKEEHRSLARALRALKRAIARRGEVRIRKEARGQILTGAESDLRGRSIDRDTLLGALHPIPRSVSALADRLPRLLVPSERHGGYAFLMDLLLAWDELLRLDSWRDAGELETAGALPEGSVEAVAAELLEAARDLLRVDKRNGTFDGEPDDPGCSLSRAYEAIAVEMVCRDYGLGSPEWCRCSQKQMIRLALPDRAGDGKLSVHQRKIDYLVRRLRKRRIAT